MEHIALFSGIIIAMVAGIFSAVVAATNVYGNYMIKKMELKEKQAAAERGRKNQKAIIHDIKSVEELKQVLSKIQEITEASRVNVWMFHNGGYYYTGEPIQRMTMITEKNKDGVEPVKHKSIGIPVRMFGRNLAKLVEKDTFYSQERNELAYNDALSLINLENQVISSALFKLKSSDNKDWVGILAMGWTGHNELTVEQVELIVQECKNISHLLTPDYLSA